MRNDVVTDWPLDRTKRVPGPLEVRTNSKTEITAIWWPQYELHVAFKSADWKRARTVALANLAGAALEKEFPDGFFAAVRAKAESFYGVPMPFELQRVLDRKTELDTMLGIASRSA